MSNQLNYQLFEMLVELNSKSPEHLSTLTDVAEDPAVFRTTLGVLKEHLAEETNGTSSAAIQQLPNEIARSLYQELVASKTLRKWFMKRRSQLADAPPEHIAIIAEFVDIKPHAHGILSTNDGAFNRVLQEITELGDISPEVMVEALIRRDIERLARLHDGWPQSFVLLEELARTKEWSPKMRAVEGLLSNTSNQGQEADHLKPPSDKLIELGGIKSLNGDETFAEFLSQQPLLSSMLGCEIVAYSSMLNKSTTGPTADTVPEKVETTPTETSAPTAGDVLAEKLIPAIEVETIKRHWTLRIAVAMQAMRLRRFVKLDALEFRWPGLFRLLERDPASLDPLEAYFLQPELVRRPTQQSLAPYIDDIELTQLLRLQPWLRADRSAIRQAIKDTQAIPQASAAQVAQIAHPSEEVPLTVSGTPSISGRPAGTPATGAASQEGVLNFRVLHLDLQLDDPRPSKESGFSFESDRLLEHALNQLMEELETDNVAYKTAEGLQNQLRALISQGRNNQSVSMELVNQLIADLDPIAKAELGASLRDLSRLFTYKAKLTGVSEKEPIVEDEIKLAWSQIDAMVADFQRLSTMSSSFRPAQIEAVTLRSVAFPEYNFAESIDEIGLKIYEMVFSDSMRETIKEALGEDHRPLRLLVSADDPQFFRFPLECLYAPTIHRFLGMTQHASLVRYHKILKGVAPRRIETPLRVLAVLSSPHGEPWLNIRQEEDILQRTLADAQRMGLVKLQVLKGQETTRENLFETVTRWQPHIFHFTGHAAVDHRRGGSVIIVDDEHGGPAKIDSMDIVTTLAERGVRVVFLNGCGTGSTSSSDAFTGLAQALVGAGIPAVIATLRDISDRAALLFAREFYRSFVEGYSVESAVAEARKSLSLARMDWSAYALFSSLTDLTGLRLGRVQ